jgi:hypothetical protein
MLHSVLPSMRTGACQMWRPFPAVGFCVQPICVSPSDYVPHQLFLPPFAPPCLYRYPCFTTSTCCASARLGMKVRARPRCVGPLFPSTRRTCKAPTVSDSILGERNDAQQQESVWYQSLPAGAQKGRWIGVCAGAGILGFFSSCSSLPPVHVDAPGHKTV